MARKAAKTASKKASKTTSKTTSKKAKKRAPASPPAKTRGFTALAMHVTEPAGAATFAALKAEHPTTAAFALDESRPENLDPESAAKRILAHALASDAMPALTTPKAGGADTDFKSLGVETVPLTATTVVKFRQQVHGIPIYGSLISVELDDDNEMVSLNCNLAAPDVKSFLAKISPADALAKVAAAAGYGRERPQVVAGAEPVSRPQGQMATSPTSRRMCTAERKRKSGPLVYDFVIDALTGSSVAELPRTPSADAATDQALDELGTTQTFCIDTLGAQSPARSRAQYRNL